jgi:hypothetical protein
MSKKRLIEILICFVRVSSLVYTDEKVLGRHQQSAAHR